MTPAAYRACYRILTWATLLLILMTTLNWRPPMDNPRLWAWFYGAGTCIAVVFTAANALDQRWGWTAIFAALTTANASHMRWLIAADQHTRRTERTSTHG